MNIIEIDSQFLTLSGVILSAGVTLHNPHNLLAVMFELESRPDFLEIEPNRGMILQGDYKRIKMRCKNEARTLLLQLEKQANILVVRVSYFCEYNKKIMIKNNIKGWSTISKQIQQFSIPIYFNFSQEIEKIKQQAQRSESLKSSRKMNSFQKFKQSSVKKIKSSKLNEDLDFIFRNEEFKKAYQSKYSFKSQKESPRNDSKSKTSPQAFRNGEKKEEHLAISQFKEENKSQKLLNLNISSPSPSKTSTNMLKKQEKMKNRAPANNRGFQLMILAIIAALFVALGQGFGSIVKT